jgi:hypothetical protein
MISLNRLGGLLLDQEYGLLPYAPIFLVALTGLIILARRRRALFVSIATVAGAYLASIVLPTVNTAGWTGGWSPPARFLVPVVPVVAIGIVAGLRALPKSVVTIVIVIQIGIDGYFWQHPKYLWNNGTGVAAVCAQGGIPVCGLLPSFDPEVGPSGSRGPSS